VAEERPARDRVRYRERYLDEVRERLARQEQTIAHLTASGRSTALAEKRLASLRRALDGLLQRRRGWTECQDNTPVGVAPGQLGPAEPQPQPGSQIP